MARYILEVRERLELAMILVEHDMHMVMDLADRVMALDFGTPIATGTPGRGPGRPAGHRGLPRRRGDDATVDAPTRRRRPRCRPAAAHAARAPGRASRCARSDRGRWREYTWARVRRPRRARRPRGLRELGVAARRPRRHPRREPARVGARRPRRPGHRRGQRRHLPDQPGGRGRVPARPLRSRSCSIAEDEEQLDKALAVRERLPALRQIVLIDPRNVDALDDPMTSTTLGASSRPRAASRTTAQVAALDPQAPAIIVYTSGTTGPPKGAMITHANLTCGGRRVPARPSARPRRRGAVLPAAVPRRRAAQLGHRRPRHRLRRELRRGRRVVRAGPARGAADVLPRRPARVGEDARHRRDPHGDAAAQAAQLRAGCVRAGSPARMAARSAPAALATRWLARCCPPLREKLGLGRVAARCRGAAPIAPQVLEFFWALGVPVREGYGQTENTAVCTCTPADDVRIGTVGKPLAGVELRIADDGEILTRSPAVFLGYFKDPEATADDRRRRRLAAHRRRRRARRRRLPHDHRPQEGHHHHRRRQEHLAVGDREPLKVSPYVREAMVIGDRRKYLVALIGIEVDTVGDWAARQRHRLHHLRRPVAQARGARARSATWVDEVNAELAQVETIKRFALLAEGARPRGRRADRHPEGQAARASSERVRRREIEEMLRRDRLPPALLRRAGARRAATRWSRSAS